MKDLVIYSQSFDSPDQAHRWGQRQIDLLRKFSVPAYVIMVKKFYYIARELSEIDNEPIFIRHQAEQHAKKSISFNDLITQSSKKGRENIFIVNHYENIKEIAL